jgi:hypothetical protein
MVAVQIVQSDAYMRAKLQDSDLSDKSKKAYGHALDRVLRVTGAPTLRTALNAHADSIEALERGVENRKSLCGIVTALVTTMRLIKADTRATDVFLAWHDLQARLSAEITDRLESNIPTKKQRDGRVEWTAALEALEKLGREQYGSVDHLLLAMFVGMPPRRQMDYMSMHLVHEVPVDDGDMAAWLLLEKPYTMKIRKYKTAKAYGDYVVDLPETLMDIIRASLAAAPRSHLFVKRSGKPWEHIEAFTTWSNGRLKKIFGNQNVTVNSLRHSLITHISKQNLSVADMKAYAKALGHSVSQMSLYKYVD